jgi:Rrf2 family nitric oxide-sensitive transcriptional repressor
MEPNFDIVECFGASNQRCVISPVCSLKEILRQAGNEFLAVLDNYTLAEAATQNPQVEQVFSIEKLLNNRE